MEEHDGQQFAAFCEDEGDIVDVLETCVTEWTGKRAGYGDEEEREENGLGREYTGDLALRCRSFLGGGEVEVGVSRYGGEGGLDRVEEDGVCEAGLFGSVGGSCYTLLEIGP